jgi:hypothetical protein
VNGYSTPNSTVMFNVAHYRFGAGFSGDNTRFTYVFGGMVSRSGLHFLQDYETGKEYTSLNKLTQDFNSK